jgi:signal transduction histidine kinase
MKTQSLTRVLTGGVLLANLLCCVSYSVVATLHEMHGRRRAFDITLRGRADSLLGAVSSDAPTGNPLAMDTSQLTQAPDDVYQVLAPSGSVIAESSNLTPDLASALASQPAADYFDFTWGEKTYRALRLQRQTSGQDAITVVYAASTSDLRHEAVEAAEFYAKSSAALLLVVTVLVIWFLRSRLSPLKELAVRAGRVSVDSWDFDPPAEALRARELRPIATSIQTLLHGLRLSFERQRRFTGDAAHELKTSIAVLKSSLQLLTMRPRDASEYQAGVAELLFDIGRMEDLTEQMLTLARLEAEEVQSIQSVDLSRVVQSVTARMQAFAQVREIAMDIQANEPHLVTIQPKDADVLCSNLVMNALQHSPVHSVLAVSVRYAGSGTEVRVADQGEGIPSTALPHLFDRFYRVDASRSRQSGGTGLGLAICKAIVDRSHGKIQIESEPGKGTEVIVTFPGSL